MYLTTSYVVKIAVKTEISNLYTSVFYAQVN